MRGLEERLAYAKGKIAQAIDPDSDESAMAMPYVFESAKAQGVHDYKHGRFDVPALYRGVPVLVDGWNDGQNFASELEEMQNCPYCQEPDPMSGMCFIHG